MTIRRGEIWVVDLDPTKGAEMEKKRPCLVVSVDALDSLPLKAITPLTGWKDHFDRSPWLVKITPSEQNGLTKISTADCLQVRCIAENRFRTRLGQVKSEVLADVIGAIGLVVGI